MSEQRDLFSTSVLSDQSELKAHAALYAARRDAGEAGAGPAAIAVRTRVIPQGGAAAVRALRESLAVERRAVVVEAAERFPRRRDGAIPSSSILRFRPSELPRPGGGPEAAGE